MLPTVLDRSDLARQLRELGLASGDKVLVRVDFGKMGRIKKPGDVTLVESLLEVVGDRGAILALTHSPTQMSFRRDRNYVFDPAMAPCVTGRFAETVLRWPGAYRSQHPTCSIAALGAEVRELLHNHNHRSTCFGPMKELIAAGGKMLLIGCTVSSPGFSTVHYAYERLGLARRSLLSGWIGCYFRKGGRVEWFRQRDVPGCSLGYHKFYPLYRQQSLLSVGPVGRAEAFLIRAADAYRVERAAVLQDPKISLCDSPTCFSCRGTKTFNLADMPGYFFSCGLGKVWRYLRRSA